MEARSQPKIDPPIGDSFFVNLRYDRDGLRNETAPCRHRLPTVARWVRHSAPAPKEAPKVVQTGADLLALRSRA